MSWLFATGVPQGHGLGGAGQIAETDSRTIVTTYLDPACAIHPQSIAECAEDLIEKFEFLVGKHTMIDGIGRE